jgi:phospholipid/cholesterol/gamma-HCH transport system permease protein
MKNPVASIGKFVLGTIDTIIAVFKLFMETLYWTVTGPFKRKFAKSESIFDQMVFTGIQSLLIVFFVGLFTGIVIAMQSAYQLAKLGGEVYVAALVSVSMTRELGPVLTALVIAGRIGAAITAELGTMKVTEQVEALKTIALNPIRFLVVPRFLALLVMLPALTIFADMCGIIGGYLVGVYNLGINSHLYWSTTYKFLESKDVLTGLYKSIVFSIVIAMVACYQGLNTKGGAEGVGKATTVSVVTSFILVIVVDCIMTALFYFSQM